MTTPGPPMPETPDDRAVCQGCPWVGVESETVLIVTEEGQHVYTCPSCRHDDVLFFHPADPEA